MYLDEATGDLKEAVIVLNVGNSEMDTIRVSMKPKVLGSAHVSSSNPGGKVLESAGWELESAGWEQVSSSNPGGTGTKKSGDSGRGRYAKPTTYSRDSKSRATARRYPDKSKSKIDSKSKIAVMSHLMSLPSDVLSTIFETTLFQSGMESDVDKLIEA